MKKKGLIISTVVMVVVLIASLTTATYAWFSQTAKATVDELNINTDAAKGLQIAMRADETKSVDNIFSGEVTYGTTGWTGDVDTWGSSIGFSGVTELATMENAVTIAKGDEDLYTPAVLTVGTALTTDYYTVVEGVITQCTADQTVEEGKTYYTKGTATADTFITPIGYDSATKPTGYVVANENEHYYKLTFAVTNLVQAAQIGMSIEVTASGKTPSFGEVDNTKPGMTAASRISISVAKGDGEDKTADIAPFSKSKLQTNNTFTETGYDATKDGAANTDGKYAYVLDKGTITANTVYYVTMLIWIEGTDDECSNRTTGTSMNFQINFVYVESETLDTVDEWGFATGSTLPTVSEELCTATA